MRVQPHRVAEWKMRLVLLTRKAVGGSQLCPDMGTAMSKCPQPPRAPLVDVAGL